MSDASHDISKAWIAAHAVEDWLNLEMNHVKRTFTVVGQVDLTHPAGAEPGDYAVILKSKVGEQSVHSVVNLI